MDGKVIVVTGASSGIGAAAAVFLAERGDSVVIVARRAEMLLEVADRCQGRARAVSADMTERSEVRRVVGEAIEAFGRVDVWINNVGQGIARVPSELTDDDIDAMVRVNVKSALYGMQEVLTHFKRRGEGHIVNISSMLGRIPDAVRRSAYCGAKHFLNALTATFRDEVQQTHPGIAVSLVSPGVVYTDFSQNALYDGGDSRRLPNGQSVDEIAAVIAGVIDSKAPDVYTRVGAHDRVVNYFASIASDPA
jgi:short-subunit dehydrogenase